MNFIKDESKAAWKYIWTFVKWLFIAGVTGIVLTKLDGTAKGGIVIAVADALQIPVKYVGVGEKMDDLMPFDADAFVKALIG